MPVKIRLARHGRKRAAYYHIVVADSRAPRDGKIVERIGSYNPITNPATIELDFDKALLWLINGAQPTETAKTILSYKGVLMKKHLLEGVKKGAFDETEAERRYQAWKQEKDAKILAKVDKLASDVSSEWAKRLKAETKVKDARASEIAKRNSQLAAEPVVESEDAVEEVMEEASVVAVEAPAEVVVEEAAVVVAAEVAEITVEENTEEPAADVAETPEKEA